ncbi:MAG: glycosyltransferase [Saccharofermentans sp.]|nr:glycosyltransferase [Saccharofermentans sp.]
MKLAACVVLYGIDDTTVENIKTYAPYVDELWAADNTDVPQEEYLSKIRAIGENIHIIPMGGNKGIAAALNSGINAANDMGYDFILTMDQDSYFDGDTLPKYIKRAEDYFSNDEKIIQVGIHNSGDDPNDMATNCEDTKWLITSGSIMRVKDTVKMGSFLEKLFIDEVDREFNYRAAKLGYKFKRVLELTLQHHLGDPIKGKVLGKSFQAMGHSKVRKYYIARNSTYLMMEFPEVKKEYQKYLLKMKIKTLLVEPDKFTKLKYMSMGQRDAKKGKFGKLEV